MVEDRRIETVPLTAREIAALIQLIESAMNAPGSKRLAGVYRAILNKLDHAAPTER